MRESKNFQTRTEKTEPRRSAWSFVNFDDCKKGETSAKTGCTPKSGAGGKKEGEGKEGGKGKAVSEVKDDLIKALERVEEMQEGKEDPTGGAFIEAWEDIEKAEKELDDLMPGWKEATLEQRGEMEKEAGESEAKDNLTKAIEQVEAIETGDAPQEGWDQAIDGMKQADQALEEIKPGWKDAVIEGDMSVNAELERLALVSAEEEWEAGGGEEREIGEGSADDRIEKEKKEGEKEDSPSEGFVPRPELEKMNYDELVEHAEAFPNIADDVEWITEKEGDPGFDSDDAEDLLRDIVEDGIKAERSAIESGDISAINDRITHLGEKLEKDKGEMGSYDRERMGKELNELQEKREEIDQGIREKKEGPVDPNTPGMGKQDMSKEYPSKAGGLTELNMSAVSEALNEAFGKTGKGIITKVTKADAPHLRKAIKNGHLEPHKKIKGGWVLTQKGLDSLNEVGIKGHTLLEPTKDIMKRRGLDKGPIIPSGPIEEK